MFSIQDRPFQLCDGIRRRELLRVGGLALCGLNLPELIAAAHGALPSSGKASNDPTFGRAKNIIFLYLAGGPPQHETFDPKPEAPVEIRGPFHPISTNIPGIQFCELLPRTARQADKLAIVRSMATDDNQHSSSGHWVLTGNKYSGPNARTIQETDWPYFGSVVKRLAPSEALPALSTVWIPDICRLNENVTPAGQTGGLMGRQWDPDHFIGDPSHPEYRVDQFRLHGVTPMRLRARMSLLNQLEEQFKKLEGNLERSSLHPYQEQAYRLLTSGKARDAFAIHKEPVKTRERYGQNRWGQCVLLARRLIEAGVRLVHVQWPREPGDNAVDNPLWDTHAQNADRLEDVLCPQFDVGFSALIEDLHQRGLLAETLVVAIGEFGRTPKINAKGGRDHWGSVFSCALAGAGIAGGQVLGASDEHGAFPVRDRLEPGNLTATIFHLLGIDPRGTFTDPRGRPHFLTRREPMHALLGTRPATDERTAPTGDTARVPPYEQDRRLSHGDFRQLDAIRPADGPARPKGWRGAPAILEAPDDERFGVKLLAGRTIDGDSIKPHVEIGFNLGVGRAALACEPAASAYLAQEVRSPFAGRYRLIVDACGEASDRQYYDQVFSRQFRFRLLFFQFTQRSKRVVDRTELASTEFHPAWRPGENPQYESFVLEKNFVNDRLGANFSFGLGLGVAVAVEYLGDAPLQIPAGPNPMRASLCIDQVRLEYTAKPRIDEVQV